MSDSMQEAVKSRARRRIAEGLAAPAKIDSRARRA